MAPSSCGTRPPDASAARWSAIRARSAPWRSRRTARSWPRETQRARSASGGAEGRRWLDKARDPSWALVRQPYLNAIQYRFALLQAEHACRLAPDRPEYRLGLGAALYRLGHYREPIEALAAADRNGKGSPAALAFQALAHHLLGQYEQARAKLAHLHKVLDQPRGMKDAEALDLMGEARALIAPQAATTDR
jgi:tetratricopeptide (TPR) repeat protein